MNSGALKIAGFPSRDEARTLHKLKKNPIGAPLFPARAISLIVAGRTSASVYSLRSAPCLMLSIIGLVSILAIVLLLLSGRVTPIIALVLVPVVGALIAGFGPSEIGGFFSDGVSKVLPVVVMFIFAILFFGLMNDVGLFDPLINRMITFSHGSVISVAVGTVVVAAFAHLDGSGASTFLITIPALLPLYKRMRMNPYLLLLLVGTSASIVNMVPWGGPVGRAGAVLKIDPTVLWRPLIPLQFIAIFLLMGIAVILGVREKRRIAAAGLAHEANPPTDESGLDAAAAPGRGKPTSFAFNLLLTLVVMGLLVWGIVPAGLIFMIGASVALLVNFPAMSDQMARIKAHAPNALLMAAIILSAGSFLGIMNGTGMLTSIATDFVAFMPQAVSRYLHLLVAVFGVPFELVLNTDAFYFALVPVVEQIVAGHGVGSIAAVHAMIIGNIIGTFVSPFAPALWLALGLANLEMGKHIRYSLFWMWGFSLVLLVVAMMMGIFGI